MLRNIWYPVAWSDDIAPGSLFARTVIGIDVVIARSEGGTLIAMEDLCPHRLVPLSKGKVVGNAIECGYHGLRFGEKGQCLYNPHPPHAKPPALGARPFAVRETDGIVWLWPGDLDKASHVEPVRFPALDRSDFRVGQGYLHGRGNYLLLSDNILDLSHIAFLHPHLGTEAVTRAEVGVERTENVVTSWRLMRGEALPEPLARAYGALDRRIDRKIVVEWHAPATMLLSVAIGPEGEDARRTIVSYTAHLVCPETETTSHYLFAGSRPIRTCTAEQMTQFVAALASAFVAEDKPMIEAQQARIEALGPRARPALLNLDAGSIAARRILDRLTAQEQETDILEEA